MVNFAKKLKTIMSVLSIAIVIFSIAFYYTPKDSQKTKLIYEEDLTEKELPPDAVHPGELVTINYVLSHAGADDNKIIDTNNPQLAEQNKLKTYTEGPYKFIIGKSGKVKGFDQTIIGMKVGETKQEIIPPSEPPTRYTLNNTKEFPRNQILPRRQVFNMKTFKQLFPNQTPKINSIITSEKFPWKYKILNKTDEAIGAEAVVKEGQTVTLLGLEWTSTILNIQDYSFTVRHNPKEGQITNTTMGPAKISLTEGKIKVNYDVKPGQLVVYSRDVAGISTPHIFKVTKTTEQNMVIEREDNPAEKILSLNVTLLDRTTINKNE